MRKTFLAAALGAALSTGLPALDLGVHSGYTSFNMGELNTGNAALIGYSGSGTNDGVKSGLVLGADLTQPLNAWLRFGLRGEWMQSNQGRTTDPGYGYNYTDQAWLSTVLVGLQTSTDAGLAGLSLGLGAWAGYGYATLEQLDTTGALYQTGLFMGTLPVAEFEASLKRDLGSHLRLQLTGGWRWADAGYLYNDSHQPLYNQGQEWWHGGGDINVPLNLDYSGITAQGSVSYSF